MKLKLSLIALFAITSLEATSLKEAVEKGLHSDPEIRSEVARYEGKKVSVSVSKSGYYPKLDLGAGIGWEENDRENPNTAEVNTDYTREEASARLRQPLFEGFKTQSDVSMSTADKEAVGYSVKALYENKALKIIQAYLNVLKTQKIIDLAEVNLQTHEDIFASIKQRYEQGVSDRADLIQIKGRVASAKTDLISAKNNAADARAVYIKVVGTPPEDLEAVSDNNVEVPDSLDEAIATSLKLHPTMHAALKNIVVYKSKKDAAVSGYYPQFYGDLSADYKNDADGIPGFQKNYQAMLRVQWNIFNGFKEKYEKEVAQKEVLSANEKAQDTKRQLLLETTLSWNAYSLLQQQLDPLKEHVAYSKEAKVLYQEQYNVGRRSLIDLLNSQVEAFNAQKALISAEHDEIAAKYRILNSMGKLNETLGITPAVTLLDK